MPTKTVEEIVEEFLHQCDGANASRDGGAIASKYTRVLADWLRTTLTQRDKEIREEYKKYLYEQMEGLKKIEKTVHTPNCSRGTCKYNHAYCELGREDEGFNECIEAVQDLLADGNDIET